MNLSGLPPDVNESHERFAVVKGTSLRFGLAAVKNVGAAVVHAIIAEREANGPFTGMDDLILRVQHKDMGRRTLESLVKCGAMDSLGERNHLVMKTDPLL